MHILKFRADWCGPCKQLSPIAQSVTSDMGITMEDVDVDEDNNGEVVSRYGVHGIPTMIVLDEKGGIEIARASGAFTENGLRKWLEETATK